MSITPVAQYLSPSHEKTVIRFCSDAVLGKRLTKAGPARAGVKLGIRAEYIIITSYTLIYTFPFEVVVFATKWWFGAFSPRNPELLRS